VTPDSDDAACPLPSAEAAEMRDVLRIRWRKHYSDASIVGSVAQHAKLRPITDHLGPAEGDSAPRRSGYWPTRKRALKRNTKFVDDTHPTYTPTPTHLSGWKGQACIVVERAGSAGGIGWESSIPAVVRGI
jgi:hypothetical protein